MDGTVEGIGNHTLRNRALAGIMIVIKLRCTETKIVLFLWVGYASFLLLISKLFCVVVGGEGWRGGRRTASVGIVKVRIPSFNHKPLT
jgi:hypothetical protein